VPTFALAKGLVFRANNPALSGTSSDTSWNAGITPQAIVKTSGISNANGTPTALSLRMDRMRGEITGSYLGQGNDRMRRSVFGLVMDPTKGGPARGWIEMGTPPQLKIGTWSLINSGQ
jgi:hypothetical protein